MIIEELTYFECQAMLQRAEIARLACAVDNQPYIVPINVDFGDGCLYGYSTMGRKNQLDAGKPTCVSRD